MLDLTPVTKLTPVKRLLKSPQFYVALGLLGDVIFHFVHK